MGRFSHSSCQDNLCQFYLMSSVVQVNNQSCLLLTAGSCFVFWQRKIYYLGKAPMNMEFFIVSTGFICKNATLVFSTNSIYYLILHSQEALQKNPSFFTLVKTVKTKIEEGTIFFLTLQCFFLRSKDSILKFFKEHIFYRPGYRSFEKSSLLMICPFVMIRKLTLKLYNSIKGKKCIYLRM